MKRTVGIVGGGAAGMTAALFAARQGAEVTIFEKNDRLGKKILSTGNGKCNLGNRVLGLEQYNTSDPELLAGFLERFGTDDTEAFFAGLGLLIKEKNGYLYPVSEQASSVLDVLRFAIDREPGILVKYLCPVEKIEAGVKAGKAGEARRERPEKQEGQRDGIRLIGGGESFCFDSVILACGGRAAPKTGSDGGGYRLARQLGHGIVPVVPALVQLRCREEWFKSVAGVRADATVTLCGERGGSRSERGELQLTDYGISGIPVFQLSRHVGYILREQNEVEIRLDFLPDYGQEDFAEKMIRIRVPEGACGTLEEYFAGVLNKKLMTLLIRLAGMRPSDSVRDADPERIKRVYELCRRLSVHVNAANSYENAQACAGGVPLREVTERLESLKVPGVYFAGELLDVDGRCGGYNLQWAWCSGSLAGRYAAEGRCGESFGGRKTGKHGAEKVLHR
ncbi:MAG: aminoacetone oxidase family FAD-binding enzyme [bacterium]|nr:aminoacetone oxidase family FAD-binding enzyme [bacterium]